MLNNSITVGFPLFQDCTLLDFAGATQMFTPFTGANFIPIWIGMDEGPIKTTEGVSVLPSHTFKNTPEVDIVFLPGGGGRGVANAMLDKAFVEEIDNLAEKAEWAGSICTGAFIFAATGRFNGAKATTYWSQLKTLNLFPQIEVDLDSYPSGIIDPINKLFSGGGVSSSIDLALELVKHIRGEEACQVTELATQYAPEPPTQAGNPYLAPNQITETLTERQAGFTRVMEEATRKAISQMK